jgi:hypothetical protein
MRNRRNLLVIFVLLILVTAASLLAESGSTVYSVSKTMFIAGTEIQAGAYDVKWQSHSPEVTVIFKSKGKVIATVKGKLEKLDKVTDYTSMIVGKDSAGRDAIQALQFGGKKYRVAF